jgi:ubiquinone/menaquinone biosynthesis C-methylase UbiE
VQRVIAIDSSAAMLQAAKRRLQGVGNVEIQRGELEALPLEDDTLDAATLMLVLPYLAQPGRALSEAARVLKPGGRLLIADLMSHDRETYRQQLGHAWLGFSSKQMASYLDQAGFEGVRVRPLPSDPRAKGPALFAATGRVRSS